MTTLSKYDSNRAKNVAICEFIGYRGFFSPRDLIIIDPNALSDPLLARLPVRDFEHWRIGHFNRNIPSGYLQARQNDDVSAMNPSLALYYQKLRLVTSGDLLDPDRLDAIIGFQLGLYDHWRNEYLAQIKQ